VRVGTIIGFQNPPAWRRPWTEVYAKTLDFAVLSDVLGLDEVWLTEHHFAEDGYCPALMPVAGAIAARTARVRIGTKVMLMPFHEPLRLAEDAAVVDIMSGGRLDLGIAAGYRPEEFRGFGVPLAERSARTREGLEILSVALHGDEFSYEGRFHHYDRARVSPEPVQQPIPMWVGGRSAGPLRRAAHDGYHLQLADFDPVQCAADHAVYTQALLDEGRDPAEHEIAAVASIFVHATPARARELAEPHMRYQQDQYSRWFAAAADRPSLTPSDTELPPGCLAGTPS
jgi:alkanesulfonate monooxygenase SsuD/methylene tetrahydromethanopterin reductase-like flavin-dependent oxidoreductase (luciferase family)